MPIEIRELTIKVTVRPEAGTSASGAGPAEDDAALLRLLAGAVPPEGPAPEGALDTQVPAPILVLPAADGLDLL